MPRIDYTFDNLLGIMYRRGNILFSPDNTAVYAPIGHRVTRFSLTQNGAASTFSSFETFQPIVCQAISPCGRLLLVVDERGGAVLVNCERDSAISRISFKAPVTAVSFSPDGQLIAAAVGKLVQIWKVPNMDRSYFTAFSLVRTMSGHSEKINSIEWSRNGAYLVTAGDDMVSRIYTISAHLHDQKKRIIPIMLQAHKHAVIGAFFMADDQRILTVGKDGAAFEWSFDPEKGRLLTQPGQAVQHLLMLHKDGQSEDETFRPWISDIRYNAELGMLIVGYLNGSFGLFKQGMFEGDPYQLVHGLSLSTRMIDAVAVSPNGQWLCFGSGPTGQLLVWEWSTETYILKQHSQQSPQCITYSPDGALLAAGGADGRVRIWSARGGQSLVTFSINQHQGPVTGVAFSRQGGRVLVSAGQDGTVRAWDAIKMRADSGPFRVMTCPQETHLTSVTVDGAGEVVVAGDASGQVFVWSLRDGQLIDTLHGHEGAVVSIAFDPVGTGRLMTASWDRTVRLWSLFDRDKKMAILEHESDVLCAAWRPDGREIAAACLSGGVDIWGTGDIGDDYALLRRIDLKRDIADKPLSSAHVRSLSFSLDGQFLFVAGAFPFAGIYDADAKVLLRRYPLSLVKKDAKASGNESKEAKSIACSPHGHSFAILNDEGILTFSRNFRNDSFDPVDLDIDLTPERAISVLEEDNDYAKALAMSCRLNISNLIIRVINAIPTPVIPIICRTLSVKYVAQVLKGVIEGVLNGQRVQFGLCWVNNLLLVNGVKQGSSSDIIGAIRMLEKRLTELQVIDRVVREAREECRFAKLQSSFSKQSISIN